MGAGPRRTVLLGLARPRRASVVRGQARASFMAGSGCWLLAGFSSVRALILQQASLGSFTWWSQVSSCSKRSQAQVRVKFLLASCLLLTPWPKQSVWKDQDTGKLTNPGHDQNNLPHRRCPELTSLLRIKSLRVVFPLWCNLPFLIQFNKHILWGYWEVECVILVMFVKWSPG